MCDRRFRSRISFPRCTGKTENKGARERGPSEQESKTACETFSPERYNRLLGKSRLWRILTRQSQRFQVRRRAGIGHDDYSPAAAIRARLAIRAAVTIDAAGSILRCGNGLVCGDVLVETLAFSTRDKTLTKMR